jgi:hypothetical protein
MTWFEGTTYVDNKGNTYHVIPYGVGESRYRTRCYMAKRAGGYFVQELPERATAEEAQRDLDAHALKKGWTKG